ncbi:phosphatidylglycerophosphatase A [Celerinatantimonas sp. YJH-8]|uniref:phosphatidylglycerophosphatase A family protein n=1 Tax=Celerinatantimonas sp. YJH-8 TaxID=3228714 RepID=UPI0038BFA567
MDKYLKKLSLSNPLHLCAIGFGSGLAAKAPGTWGTLAAVPLMAILSYLTSPWIFTLLLVVGFIWGVWCCNAASRVMGVHDHGGIVWDEFIGLGITLIAIPLSPWSLLSGFIFFRIFDIWKPWPIRWFDRSVKGGFGIMIDDVCAGIIAWFFQLCLFYWIF